MPADRGGGTGTLRRWLRLVGLAFVLFVLPMLLVWPLASFLVERAAELGSVSPVAAFSLVVGLLGLDAVAMIPHGLIGALAGTATIDFLSLILLAQLNEGDNYETVLRVLLAAEDQTEGNQTKVAYH